MSEKDNHNFDSMGQLCLFFRFADLCTVCYCTTTWYNNWYIQQMQNLKVVNRKVVAGFGDGFLYRVLITYWQLQYLGRILIKQLIGK